MKCNQQGATKQDLLEVIDILSDRQEVSKQEILDTVNSKIAVLSGQQQETLETINDFASHTEIEIAGLKSDVGNLKSDVSSLKADVNHLTSIVNTQMVTKDYLDEKMYKLRGDIVSMVRKEDDKVDALTSILSEKKVLSKTEARKIVLMGPITKTR
jgi:hypothetical protein